MIGKKVDGGVGLVDIELKWSKILINKDYVINHIIDNYLGRFQIDINYILSLSETKSSNLQLLHIFQYFNRKFYVTLMNVNNKSTRKKCRKLSFAQQPIS